MKNLMIVTRWTTKNSISIKITFNWIIQGFWGPGLGLKELRELAASDNACSMRDAASDAAWTESTWKTYLTLKKLLKN